MRFLNSMTGTGKTGSFRFFLIGILLGTASTVNSQATFVEETTAAGLHHIQSERGVHELAVYAGAVAAVDVNGNGWTDLVVARSDGPLLLYMNQGDGTFREEGVARGVAVVSGAGGIAAGDFSNSGRKDLFVVPLNGYRCYFLVNDGNGYFTERAVERGLDLTTTLNPHHGFSVSLVDYNRDGYLDIYFTEWGVPSSEENHLHSALLRNRGAEAPGFFENVTGPAGLTQPGIGSTHFGFAAAWVDFDGDGWPDLALVGDFGTSQLFWNNGDGTFTERGRASGVALDENGMGVAVADFDGDGRFDFYVTSIYDPVSFAHSGVTTGNKLYRNTGDRRFTEMAGQAGVALTGWGWGAAFFDSDNRGAVDLVVTNGITDGLVPDPAIPSSTDTENQPTLFYRNDGQGNFTDRTASSGIADRDQGRAIVILDYNQSGALDVLITNAYGPPILYRNQASSNGNHWIRFEFEGVRSNRDGIGTIVKLTHGGRERVQLFNPTNSFLGQHESFLHFGLGAGGGAVERVEVIWPSGTVQILTDLASNKVHRVVEPEGAQVPPNFTLHPVGGAYAKDEPLTLRVQAEGVPSPVYVWERNGIPLSGVTGPSLFIDSLQPYQEGIYTVRAINPAGVAISQPASITVTADLSSRSIAEWWMRALLDAIRADFPSPPIHARNLYHLSAALWDAFWAYDASGWEQVQPMFVRESPVLGVLDRELARREAMSYAAYRILTDRYRTSLGSDRSMPGLDWLMRQLGYPASFTGTTGTSPAAVGNRIGLGVLEATRNDGASEGGGGYEDTSDYVPRNEPMNFLLPGAKMASPNHWQPLAFARAVTQNQIDLGTFTQPFVGSNWSVVRPFALEKPTPTTVALDPGPPPLLGGQGDAEFRAGAVEVIRYSAMLDPADGVELDISPGALMNNPPGTNTGRGHGRNPVTDQPYAPNRVLRADYARVLAEYWADGPASETPPGHWNVILNEISADSRLPHRFGGAGPVLSRLEWDVTAYLALNGAMHDAAIAGWAAKRKYDSARPISMIRYLSGLGQSTDSTMPGYHADGIPLEPGIVEVITEASSSPGQRHAHLSAHIGKVAIRSWKGAPVNWVNQTGGVGWILGERWMPYQMDTFVTPAFPGYVSGHSIFSRAAAEVLTRLTGSAFFPGGLKEKRFGAGEFLIFEYGPQREVVLQWATYYDAGDQAGQSRVWGGIHPSFDDFPGRTMGITVGRDAFLKVQSMRGGEEAPPPLMPSPSPVVTPPPSAPLPPPVAPSPGGSSGGGSHSILFVLLVAFLLTVRHFTVRDPS